MHSGLWLALAMFSRPPAAPLVDVVPRPLDEGTYAAWAAWAAAGEVDAETVGAERGVAATDPRLARRSTGRSARPGETAPAV